MNMGLSLTSCARFAQKSWGRKNNSFLSLIIFYNHAWKKETSPMVGVPNGTFYWVEDYLTC
jgi:hypothetical protein